MGNEYFFWYRLTRVVLDKVLLNGLLLHYTALFPQCFDTAC